MIEKYLMTNEEYKNAGKHPIPYTYSISKHNQHLYYFGANHSRDPQDKQFEELRKFWEEFLHKTSGENRAVLIEGGIRETRESEALAIHRDSEAGFISYLAREREIPIFSPEPTDEVEQETLLKKYSREELACYYFLQYAYQWSTYPEGKRPDLAQYVTALLLKYLKGELWNTFDMSLDRMKGVYLSIFKKEFDIDDTDFLHKTISPTQHLSVTNSIARSRGEEVREPYILKEIEKSWNESKSLFIIYGASHAVIHEKAIRSLVNSPAI